MEKDEQIIKEQLECIAENLNRNLYRRMTREEMIKALEEYCSARSFCTDCPLKKFKNGVPSCRNYFSEMPDKELEERMDLIEKEKDTSQEAVKGIIKRLSSLTAKADAGKAPISLVPMEIVWAIAWIRKYGNEKYGDPNNWKTVEPERYRDALMRHILHYISDPRSVDEESGYPHLWHAACNMAFLMNMDYGDMCHYDFAVKKPEWEKIGKDAVENSRFSPSEVMHDVNDRLGKEIGKVIDEAD